jgi:hypothetical protein
MAVTLTYDGTLSRVEVAADGLGSVATALVERSTDQITWTVVRGGTAAPVASGALILPVSDYEFEPNVLNYYRVTVPVVAAFVSQGTAAHAVNANVTPGMPASTMAGDLLLAYAAIRNSGSGTPNTPTGYTLMANLSNARLFAKIHSGSEVAPTISFTGGASGQETSAQMCAFRGAAAILEALSMQLNSSAQNIAYPALEVQVNNCVILWIGWKMEDWTSVDTLAGALEIGDPATVGGGNGQGIVWDFAIQSTATAVNAGSFIVNGPPAAISRAAVMAFRANGASQTGSITPTLTTTWLKSVGRPFLNRPIELGQISPIRRSPRHAVYSIIDRSMPIALTEVRTAPSVNVQVITHTTTERQELDLLLASGDQVLLQSPPGGKLPTNMHAVIGETSEDHFNLHSGCTDPRVYELPLQQVAPPDASVVPTTATWQTVINRYPTWADVIAAHPTWADLLTLVADPSEVIVP